MHKEMIRPERTRFEQHAEERETANTEAENSKVDIEKRKDAETVPQADRNRQISERCARHKNRAQLNEERPV